MTADYDLFSIWPKTGKADVMATRHNVNAALLAKTGNAATPLAGGVARMGRIDDRLQHLEVQLDQAWDLLRQRRALEELGNDPEGARERPGTEVEGYLQ